MPLKVPFTSPFIVLILIVVVVVADVVYVSSLARSTPLSLTLLRVLKTLPFLSLFLSLSLSSENLLAAERRALYARNAEFFHWFSSGTLALVFPDRARVHVRARAT